MQSWLQLQTENSLPQLDLFSPVFSQTLKAKDQEEPGLPDSCFDSQNNLDQQPGYDFSNDCRQLKAILLSQFPQYSELSFELKEVGLLFPESVQRACLCGSFPCNEGSELGFYRVCLTVGPETSPLLIIRAKFSQQASLGLDCYWRFGPCVQEQLCVLLTPVSFPVDSALQEAIQGLVDSLCCSLASLDWKRAVVDLL